MSSQRNCLLGQLDSTTKKCKKCESMYYPNGSRCFLVTAESCISTDGISNKCSSCLPGMIKHPNGGCSERILNCIEYSDFECTQCKSTFYPDGKYKCSPVTTQHCAQSDGTVNYCSSCLSGHFLNTNRHCQKIDLSNCKEQYSGHPVCKICNDNYYLTEDLTCAPQQRYKCTTYESNKNICTACQDKYVLAAGTCWWKYPGRCIEGNPDLYCWKCQGMHRHTPTGTCINNRKIDFDECLIKIIYGRTDYCRKNFNGYYYAFTRRIGVVEMYPISINNCVYNVYYQNRCKVCEPGYYRNDDDLCVPL